VIVVAVLLVAVLLAIAVNVLLPRLLFAIGHSDEVYGQAISPDGRVMAVARYFDTPTFGYYHIDLRQASASQAEQVIEFAAEGFVGLRWKNAKTLIVSYDSTKYKDPDEDTTFVRRPDYWQDVHILYEAHASTAAAN